MEELPEVIELGEQESEWVFWGTQDCPGAAPCDCGHEGMGVSWHMRSCPAVVNAWKWRAKQLHDENWEMVTEVRSLDRERESLRAALQDALEGMQEMILYVPDYFRDKWELSNYIERAEHVMRAIESRDAP